MHGAKTSKTMLPSWRRVHLHKSASFELIVDFVYKQIIKLMLKLIPKWLTIPFKNHQKNDSDKHWKHHPTYAALSDFGCYFWSQLLGCFQWRRILFCDLFFGTSGEYPLGPISASHGASLVGFLNFLVDNCQIFQSNKWHQLHLQQNKQGCKTTLPIINPSKSYVTFVV